MLIIDLKCLLVVLLKEENRILWSKKRFMLSQEAAWKVPKH
jgi:hypothetical protein